MLSWLSNSTFTPRQIKFGLSSLYSTLHVSCSLDRKGETVKISSLYTVFCKLFLVGICYGFQLMPTNESPNIPFTILRTRFRKGNSFNYFMSIIIFHDKNNKFALRMHIETIGIWHKTFYCKYTVWHLWLCVWKIMLCLISYLIRQLNYELFKSVYIVFNLIERIFTSAVGFWEYHYYGMSTLLKSLFNVKSNYKFCFWSFLAPSIVIYDNACALHAYCLNRDPTFFQNTVFLVDRLHWDNHTGIIYLVIWVPR